MIRRLQGEDARVQQMVAAGDISADEAELTMRLVKKSRHELLEELNRLESGQDGDDAIGGAST
jgi:hypothetical protein